jgi:DNA replication protein DnaC
VYLGEFVKRAWAGDLGECRGEPKWNYLSRSEGSTSQQKRRARFETAVGLINELSEVQERKQLGRALARWSRYDLVAIDEVGYVPTTEEGAELLYQVISERAERGALILTTNLPFSEWTTVFKNPRLCKAVLDRVTDRATIIETGTESYRFLRTLQVKQQAAAA